MGEAKRRNRGGAPIRAAVEPVADIPDRLYHYTPVYRAQAIVRDGVIRVATHAPPFVWLSSNPVYEATATTMPPALRALGREFAVALGRARFAIKTSYLEVIRWRDIPLGLAERVRLARRGRERGANPDEWFAVPHELSTTGRTLEVEIDGVWEAIAPDELLRRYGALNVNVMGV